MCGSLPEMEADISRCSHYHCVKGHSGCFILVLCYASVSSFPVFIAQGIHHFEQVCVKFLLFHSMILVTVMIVLYSQRIRVSNYNWLQNIDQSTSLDFSVVGIA